MIARRPKQALEVKDVPVDGFWSISLYGAVVRLYRPRPQILNGSWKFQEGEADRW